MSQPVESDLIGQMIIQFLDIMGFKKFLIKYDPVICLTPQFFDNFESRHFRLMTYFLFLKLYGAKAVKVFRSVFPSRDIKQENDFRKICSDWIKEISTEHPDAQIGKVLPIVFHRLSGEKFMRMMFRFVMFVAKTIHLTSYQESQNLTFEECENLTKTLKNERENVASKYVMFDELLDKKKEDLNIWFDEICKDSLTLQQLPNLEDVQSSIHDTMKSFLKVIDCLKDSPIMDSSIDFDERWDFHLTPENEKNVVNKLRDCWVLFQKLHKDPSRFVKEYRKFAQCEKLLYNAEKFNEIGSKRVIKLRNERNKIEKDILSTEKAKNIREEFEKEFLKLDYELLYEELDKTMNSFCSR